MNIRQTHIGSRLDLHHPNHTALRLAGVRTIGIDHWQPGRVWGRSADRSGSHRYLVLAGTVHFSAIAQPVIAGELVTLPPGTERQRTTGDAAVTALFLDLPPVRDDRVRVLASSAADWCHASLNQLLSDALRAEPSAAAEHMCRALIAYLNPAPHIDAAQSREQQGLSELWQQVRQHPRHTWSVDRLAAEMGCSAGHLHRLCTRHADTTPMRMVTHIRLDHAAALLHGSDFTLSQIADAIGFATAPAFSDAFVQRFGQRPGAWRHTK